MRKIGLMIVLIVFSSAAFAQITDLADLCAGESLTTMDVLAQGAAGCAKIGFATFGLHDGNLGGFAGANQICQQAANAGGLPGRYHAWLSDGIVAPNDGAPTFRHSSLPYYMPEFDTGSITLASNYTGLSGSVSNAFRLDELGERLDLMGGFVNKAWTGVTQTGGTASTNNCQGWTSNSSGDDGDYGLLDNTSGWSHSNSNTCDNQYHLYCFQM